MSMNLEQRWQALCKESAQPLAGRGWGSIVKRYGEPHRAYHTLDHIADSLAHFDTVRSLFARPVEVEFALWYHDLIYDPKAKDNEEQSARASRVFLRSPVDTACVMDLIRATAHGASVLDRHSDAALLCDIDLAILGSDPNSYDQYAKRIRQEYAFVADSDYRVGRVAVLRMFLERPSLYQTDACGHLESKARENLQREADSLEGESC